MTDQKPRDQGPDFVGVGVQKSGTSWLIQALQQHPAIYVKKKEISFFVQNFHRGYEWYHSFFAEKDGRLAGELTVSYFIAPRPNPSRKEFYPRWNPRRRLLFWRRQPSARDELHRRYPGIRIFAIFRNPVERAWSHYWFWRKRKERIGKAHRVVQFENMFANDGRWIYSYGCYARTLRYWREVFPDMGVFFFDDLKADAISLRGRVLTFLGADPGQESGGLSTDFNRKKESAFAGLMGERVASKGVTVVDDGTIEGRRGSLSVDDEGTPSGYNVLIEDGILVGYMQDRQNARLMGMQATGNGRRQSYAHQPMPRMTNTYMLSGDKSPEEMISSVKKGLYAVSFGGGQVDITSGKFVFGCTEAYMIEDGKIGAPVTGAMLIGNGPEAMQRISMVGNDSALDTGIGMCGKAGQSVPVGVGQPHLLMNAMTVGGTQT